MRREKQHLYFSQQGFTLLELLIVVFILGLAAALDTGFESLNSKKTYQNTVRDLRDELAEMRYDSEARNTTTRVNLALADGVYTLSTFFAPAVTGVCNNTGAWTAIKAITLPVPSVFEITGTGLGDVCFDPDQSSTGGVYTIAQIDEGTELGNAVITVVMATGFVDVVE